jgi:hypothetical protein
MKKLWMFVSIVCLCMSFSAVGLAHSMTVAEMSIGGIAPQSTFGYVKQVYGLPSVSDVQTYNQKNGQTIRIAYIYNTILVFSGITHHWAGKEDDELIYHISCRANNLLTPSGFTRGTKYNDVVKKFGAGDLLDPKSIHNAIDGCKYYDYVVNDQAMTFAVDKEGIVCEITIDMYNK